VNVGEGKLLRILSREIRHYASAQQTQPCMQKMLFKSNPFRSKQGTADIKGAKQRPIETLSA
jgi:hypothetical protein